MLNAVTCLRFSMFLKKNIAQLWWMFSLFFLRCTEICRSLFKVDCGVLSQHCTACAAMLLVEVSGSFAMHGVLM